MVDTVFVDKQTLVPAAWLNDVNNSTYKYQTNVKNYGAMGDGMTDDTTAFTSARAVSTKYHIPAGNYILDASFDPFIDLYTSDNDVTLTVGGVPYTCSNAFAGRLRWVAASNAKTDLIDSKTGNTVLYYQNSNPGTATGFYRGLAFTCDSHFLQAQPDTNGGSCDLLFQRSTLNADPGGNRFNITFEETADRLLISHATTAAGFPSFDSAIIINGGSSASMQFPGLQPQFNQGISVKQRAAGGFEIALQPTSSTVTKLQQIGGAGTEHFSFKEGAIGVFGSSGTGRIALPAAAIDPATTMALVNAIRTALINFGWCS